MKRTKQTFNLILTLALWLVAAQTAWATDETKTFTISSASGSGTITYGGNVFLVPVANMMTPESSGGSITMRTNTGGNEGTVKLYPRISGKVKSLTFSSARIMFSDVVGTEHYVKIGKGDIWTNSYTENIITATALTFTFTNGDGLQLENEDDYLEIKMRNSETTRRASFLISGTLTITYEPTASTLTHTHNFSYNAVGNTLTATCAHDDGKECNLASSSYQISTSLMAPTFLIFTDGWNYPASMSGFENFRSETKATIGSITYIKTDTNEDYGTSEPNATGTYTASVTITAGGTGYTLQTSYRVTDYHFVYNNYPQFTITTDKSGNYAGNGQTVTITFTPKFGETLTGLTVTGATTNYSIGSGITDNGSNTYTFIMPGEDVTIGATFSISENDFAETGTDEYTIKTANGWGWFCFAVNCGLAPDGFSGKTVKLAANVSSSEMAGAITLTGETPNGVHPFKGTFDGQGYTLTFNHNASEHYCAPFRYTDGATIRNLNVGGTITGNNYKDHGGLVGLANGNITIDNCRVSTQISTTYSGSAWHGGVIAEWKGSDVTCTVTGCVYDGLIYNPSEADATSYCSGFIGLNYGTNMTIAFTDCLYIPAAYGTGKYALDDYCFTFVYPINNTTYNMTNCYYTTALGKRQGRPAAVSTTAPANLGSLVNDRELVDGYQNGLLYNSKYYTPKYGELAVEYAFDDILEQATTTIDRTLYRDGDWNTLCLPFSQSAYEIANSSLNNAVIMELNSSASNLDNEGLLTLYFLPATSIVAGRPYIVKWSYDDTANPLKPIFNPSDEFVAALNFISEVPTVDGGRTSNWGTNGSENYDMLVDGDTSTKYGLSNNDPYVEFHYQTAITPKGYALWTANDTEGMRNPKQWTILAKRNKNDSWTTLITVDNTDGNKLPMANNLRTVFALNNNEAYQYFRFEATRRSNSGQLQFQLAELQFCTVQPVETLLPHTDIVSPKFPVSEENINPEASTVVNFNGGQFVGTLSPVAVSGGDRSILFLGAANTLYYPSRAMTIGAYRAYFHIGSSAGIKDFRLNFGEEDEATSIDHSPLTIDHYDGAAWYDLNGRKLQGKPSQKGIYIVNGKKVLY